MDTKALKYLRKKNKISQKALADTLGVSRSTISNYEQGIRNPDIDTLCKIADLFDVTVDYLLGRSRHHSDIFDFIRKKNDIIIIVNLDTGNIINISKEAEKFYQYSNKEFLSMYIWDISLHSKEEMIKILNDILVNKKRCFEDNSVLANGQLKKVKAFITPLVINKKNIAISYIYEKKAETQDSILEEKIFSNISFLASRRSPYKYTHEHNVLLISDLIAKRLRLKTETVKALKQAALLHDVGLLNIPSEIINKPSRLNKIEFELIKSHSIEGINLLKKMSILNPLIIKAVEQHHEMLDGSGYPYGLKDEEIETLARIISVADVIEAMSSDRPHRKAPGIDKAIEEINLYKGIKYDKKIANISMELYKNNYLKFLDL